MKTQFYVMHYKKNEQRKANLIPLLEQTGIDPIWYLDYDKDELNDEILGQYYTPDLSKFKERTSGMYPEVDYEGYQGVTLGGISLCIKHIKCMEDLVASDFDCGVFLEDDVVLNIDKKGIENYTKQIKGAKWDAIFFGGGFDHNLVASRVAAKYKDFILVDHPATNCTSSYIITKEAAKKVLSTFTTICTSIDWELNYHFKVNNLKVWHTVPYTAGQLSTAGVYECTL